MAYPLVVAASGTTGSGPSVLRGRQIIGEELGFWHPYEITTEASGLEGNRYVIIDELVDDEDAAQRLGGAYVYVRTGDQAGTQRRLLKAGYDGPVGALAVSRVFDAPLADGDVVELSYPLPVRPQYGRKGLMDLLEEACDRVVVDVRLPLVGNGTTSVDVSAYDWLRAYEQTRGIYDSRVTTDRTSLSAYPYTLAQDGATLSVVTTVTYGEDEAFELAVAMPGNLILFDGSAWGYFDPKTISDIADDTYQLAVPEHWIRAFGMVKALQHLVAMALQDESLSDTARTRLITSYDRRMATYARAAARITVNEFSPQLQEVTRGLATTATVSQTAWPSTRSSWGQGWPA